MKLSGHIIYKDRVYTTKLEFASEESTIKLLGLTAAHSYVTQNSTVCGGSRHKESMYTAAPGSFYLPVDVSKDPNFADPVFLDPDHSIKKYFHDGEDVYIKLLTQVDINSEGLPYLKPMYENLSNAADEINDEDAEEFMRESKEKSSDEKSTGSSGQVEDELKNDFNQQMNDWFVVAFRRNQLSVEKLQRIRNRNRAEEYAAIKRLERFKVQEKKEELSAQTNKIRAMLDTQIYTDVRQTHLMDSAWVQLTEFGRLDKVVNDPVEQDLIKVLFRDNYILLWETFRMFASLVIHSTTGMLRLDIWEFKQFLIKLKLLNAEERDANPEKFDQLVNNVFSECFNDAVELEARLKGEIYSPEFFLALIHIAHIMYIDVAIQRHMPHLSYTQSNRKRSFLLSYITRGNGVTMKGSAPTETYNVAIQNTETSPHKALQRLLQEYILPFGNEHLQTYLVKQALSRSSILMYFAEADEYLVAAYKKYSYLSPGTSLMQTFMWYKQVMAMALECKLLKADFDFRNWAEWPFYVREIRLGLGAILAEGNEQSDSEEKINYPEFLESIARLSIVKHKKENRMSVDEKIYDGIQSVVQLMKQENKKNRKKVAMGSK